MQSISHQNIASTFFFAVLFWISATTLSFGQAFLLDVSLPITGNSSQATIRALETTLQTALQTTPSNTGKAVNQSTQPADKNDGDGEVNEDSPVGSDEKPTIILQFRVPKDQEQFGRGSRFGACYELADFLLGEQFQAVRTVAWFPQTVKGHAVLAALACNERVVATEAEIGEAAVDESDISATQRKAYQEIAERRGGIPSALVDKLLDPQTVLLQVETEHSVRLANPKEVEKLRETESFVEEPTVLIPVGQPGLFSADSARKINLVDRIADDRIALARSLGYRPDDLKFVVVTRQLGSAIRINLDGPINNDKAHSVIRRIQTAVDPMSDVSLLSGSRRSEASKVDFICLCINSPGGNIEASLNLASYIVQNVDSSQIRIIAYIPDKALSDAALIAVACDEIVLGPDATLGGDGASVFSEQQIADARLSIRDSLSKESLRSWSLPVAFIDPEIEVFQATRQGRPTLVDYFSEEELEQQPDATLWKKEKIVKPKGKLLKITGGEDARFLVDRSAKDFAEFKRLYRLEDEPLLVEPGWADRLLQFLASPGMSATILFVVFMAVMIELQSPGLGFGTFIAVLGIVLFFWIHFLGGTAGWLEILLFLLGVLSILIEIFLLPGTCVFGIGGALAIIASLVLASQTFIIPQNSYQYGQLYHSLLILAVSGVGVFVLAGTLTKTIHRIARPKDLELIQKTEELANYDSFLGCVGLTLTPLVPSGKAVFDDETLDVVSDGALVEKSRQVEVIEVVGYRVVVREIS